VFWCRTLVRYWEVSILSPSLSYSSTCVNSDFCSITSRSSPFTRGRSPPLPCELQHTHYFRRQNVQHIYQPEPLRRTARNLEQSLWRPQCNSKPARPGQQPLRAVAEPNRWRIPRCERANPAETSLRSITTSTPADQLLRTINTATAAAGQQPVRGQGEHESVRWLWRKYDATDAAATAAESIWADCTTAAATTGAAGATSDAASSEPTSTTSLLDMAAEQWRECL
jgi:hypothetical protein